MIELVSHSAPYLRRVNVLLRIELPRLIEQDVCCFRVCGVRDATIVDWTHRRALRLVKVTDAFGAAIVCDHINVVANSLAVADMVPLPLCIAPSFEDRLVRTFGQAGSTGNAFIGNQQCHDPCLLLTTMGTNTVDKTTRRDHS